MTEKFLAYSNLSLHDLRTTFGLTIDQTADLFSALPAIDISTFLQTILNEYVPLANAISTEKARSELIIAPILVEVRRLTNHQISLFSGIEFNVAPDKGLNGICDFVLSRSPGQFFITAPVLMMVEAKNEHIKGGLIQCIAEMVAARIFNQREGNDQSTLYGAVTTGTLWKFLKLEGETAFIDQSEYHIDHRGKIMAILMHMVAE